MMHKTWCSIKDVPYNFWGVIHQISRSHGRKISDSNPISVRLLGRSQLSNPSDLPCWEWEHENIFEFLIISITHWGRATHICVGKLTIIGSDNGMSPGRRQAIIWTIAGMLLIGPLGTNFSEILIGIQTFSFKKMHLKMASAKWRPFVWASMC